MSKLRPLLFALWTLGIFVSPAARADEGVHPHDLRFLGVSPLSAEQPISLKARTSGELLVLGPLNGVVHQISTDKNSVSDAKLTATQEGGEPYLLRRGKGMIPIIQDAQIAENETSLADVARANDAVITPSASTATTDQVASAKYKLTGDHSLMPVSISDDGYKVYIVWGSDQPIPVVLSVDLSGQEEMTDGYMRDGRFVLDRIYPRLVFRIDKAETWATRLVSEAGEGARR